MSERTYPPLAPEPAIEETDDGPQLGLGEALRRILSWFRPYPWRSAVIFGCLLVEMVWTATIPLAFEHMIDHAIGPKDYGVLVQVLVVLGGGALVVCAVGLYRDFLYARLSNTITNDLRVRLFSHLQSLSLSFHAKRSPGDIAARFSGDLESINQSLQSWIAWGILPALDVLTANVLLFTIDWRLALLAQLIWPLALFGPRLIGPRATAASYRYKQEEGRVLAEVNEAAGGRPVIKAFGLEYLMQRRFDRRVDRLRHAGLRMGFLSSLLERSSDIGIMVLQVLVLGVGGTMTYHGTISLGALVAFQSLFMSMSYALFYLAQYVPTLSHSAAGMSRLEEVFSARPALAEAPQPRPLPPLSGGIELVDVVFSHEPDKRILDGISLSIRHGESVAFVGPSGSGKSTVLSLLLRFYDPDSGTVRYDGRDLRAVARADFVAQTAVVFQESFLFNLSLRENIRLGRPDASDADVESAARAAEIHDYIVTLPLGYDTPAGERGGTLSGGQRQRIAIARALLRDPRVLFLDEATSALDPGTEVAINATIARVARGRTVISVTHRLSAVVDLDRIFVLERGRLAESGSHRELLARGGVYADLWRKQSGLHVSADGSEATVTPERLKAIPLLAAVDDAILARLAGERLQSESFPPGRPIVIEGDPGDRFYLLVRGSVAVTKKFPEGDRRLAVLQDGDHFGEIALLRQTPRTATVTALSPVSALSLSRGHFLSLLDQVPGLRERLETDHAARSARSAAAGAGAGGKS